jgi:7-cyano-7-deazaguanine synthase
MEALVLLSGGIDSAACAAFYRQLGHIVSGLFVDYGQPVREQEEKSAAAIAAHYKIPFTTIRCAGPETNYIGEIGGRNAFLAFAALLFRPVRLGIIALGIHHGTTYYDCSESFAEDLGRIISGYTSGLVTLGAPFLNWDKQMVYQFAGTANVPVELTWSCEVGPAAPCGQCLSCRDRERLNVRASI